ncbi:MAG TPA: phosphate ABC transporter substrate-binding/OmpA family protein [Polyangiaceae bacterium]|nr:phosphate ABC transporter substrate-binding/OmpA family protein [Polyangiaceae bacterium]
MLTRLSKALIAAIAVASTFGAVRTHGKRLQSLGAPPSAELAAAALKPATTAEPVAKAPLPIASSGAESARKSLGQRPLKVAVSQWPGHMALLVGAGGLKTTPGSIAAEEGLDLEIVFIEDAPSKNKALQTGEVDFVWQTVDELPISLGGYRAAGVEVRAALQIDWSRGGDACVASREVKKVEDILGRKSAMLMFSPDHTVFEFMITNSRLTPEQVVAVRRATQFSPEDFTFARTLFTEGKIDVACLWEPDVTLALEGRPGSHRLFSTADATELVADVLLARKDVLSARPDLTEKLARVWFRAVERANRDKKAAARLISTVASRFRDELGYERTLKALDWAKWTDLSDNVRFFGLDGGAPAFDRVYNQADSIWINYPEAEIKERFAPVVLRDASAVKKIWDASGKPTLQAEPSYDPALARNGSPLFTKPVSINFPSGGSELGPETLAVINQQILPQLEIARGMSVRVEGNTDSVGDHEANQVLSERRAWAIVDYLASRGIPKQRMVARGNGPANPIASNKTPEGRAMNRRTDVVFIRGSKD